MNEFYINIYLPVNKPNVPMVNLKGYVHDTLESALDGRKTANGGVPPGTLTVKVVPGQVIPAQVIPTTVEIVK